MLGQSQAEDAAQETFLKAYEFLDRFRGDSSFSTWLYRIASNYCLNFLSKRKREKTDSLDALLESGGRLPSPTGQGSPLQLLADQQAVQTILEKLSPEERAILVLREIEGLNYKELAQTLEVSLDLVKVRLFRARQSFLQIAKKIL